MSDFIGYRHGIRLINAALIIITLFLSAALIVAWNTPATEYESSIYLSTPIVLWIGLIISFLSGILLVISSIGKGLLSKSYLWRYGLLLVFISYTICISLYIIRGYYFWNMSGDSGSHIGWIKETLIDGYAPVLAQNYPLTHIYISEYFLISGIDLISLSKLVPLLFGLFFVLFMYIFAKTLFSSREEAVIVSVMSCCFIGSFIGPYMYLAPNFLANLYIPFALYLAIKSLILKKIPFFILLLLIIILYPVFHIVPALFLIVAITTLLFSLILLNSEKFILLIRSNRLLPGMKTVLVTIGALLTSVIIIQLLFPLTQFERVFYQSLSSGTTQASKLIDSVLYLHGHGYNVFEHALKLYGTTLILAFLSLITFILLLSEWRKKGHHNFLISIYGLIGVTFLLIAVLFTLDLPFSPLRFQVFIQFLMMVLSSYCIYHILKSRFMDQRKPFQKVGRVLVVTAIIFSLCIAGMLNLYPSPYNLAASYHSPQANIYGMQFLFDNRDNSEPLMKISAIIWRYGHALLTPAERSEIKIPHDQGPDYTVNYHFGYDSNLSLSDSYGKTFDLILWQQDRVLYEEVLPAMAELRYTKQDFKRLKTDQTVNFIYTNGGFDFFKIGSNNRISL